MKHRTKNVLRAMAEHLRLKVCFVSYFDDRIHGKLLPREGRILINAHKPREEHIFTLLHEFGHYLMHYKSPPRKHHPRVFDIKPRINWLKNFCSKLRRQMRFYFGKESGKEWEADLWAMCAFVYLARLVGCREELAAFLERHPVKRWDYWLVKTAIFYCDWKNRISNVRKVLAHANS